MGTPVGHGVGEMVGVDVMVGVSVALSPPVPGPLGLESLLPQEMGSSVVNAENNRQENSKLKCRRMDSSNKNVPWTKRL